MKGKIRIGFIGLGYRGLYLLKLINEIDFFQLAAVAETNSKITADIKKCFESDALLPEIYTNGDNCYLDMLKSENLDLVFVASPWEWHFKHASAVLNAGCHLALEVKGSLFEGEYQQLCELTHENQLKIYPLENTVFMRNVMAVSQMVEKGVFGEIIFAQGAYRHDLRHILLEKEDAFWRTKYYETENGDIYPTHSAAPVCLMLKINRGNRFKSLASFATKAVGMKAGFPNNKQAFSQKTPEFVLGDVITTIITTESGAQITLFHDTTLPRPRSLSYEIQGTKGAWNYDLKGMYIEGRSPKELWEAEEKYIAQYEHPFWAKWGKTALIHDEHHQGMDYIMLEALAADFMNNDVYPININDLSVWADISLLSKKSIAENRIIEI